MVSVVWREAEIGEEKKEILVNMNQRNHKDSDSFDRVKMGGVEKIPLLPDISGGEKGKMGFSQRLTRREAESRDER